LHGMQLRKLIRRIAMIARMTKFYLPALASLALLFGGSAAFAHKGLSSHETKTRHSTKTERMSDTEFAQKAAEANLAEVKLGQLAEQNGTTATVKDFGKRMVTDHTQAESNLKVVAAKESISLPTELNAKDQALYDSLSKLSGQAFDRAYARDMVRDHKADIATFRNEADLGKDAAIKTFASQTLPTLETHLKSAEEMLHGVPAQKTSKSSRRSG
jgi:putative membrane protein